MKRFDKTALFASVLALGLGGAAIAQEATGGGELTKNELPVTITTISGETHEIVTPSTGGGGPLAGWEVYSSDGAVVGSVVTAAFNAERGLDYIIFAMDNGNQVQVDATGVAQVGENNLVIAVDQPELMAKATAPVTALEFSDATKRFEDSAEAKGEAVAAELQMDDTDDVQQ